MIKREFRFRAWDTRMKRFVDPKTISNSRIPVVHTKYGFKLKTKFILMQATGLKDKKGKEIYEGDIVKRIMHYGNDSGNITGKEREKISVVSFKNEEGRQFAGFDFYPCDNINKMEVIGNIYQHSHLLIKKAV